MTYLEKEIDRLENLVKELTNRIWDLEKVERKYRELLEKTGVANRNSQERGINEMAQVIMELPYLEATTMLGRAGELKRLSKKLASYTSKEVGYSVPEHLRPSNFFRSLTNRREAESFWQDISNTAKSLIDSHLLLEWEWEEASGPRGFCNLSELKTFLKRVPEVAVFEESLKEAFSNCVDGLLVPEHFIGVALQEVRDQAERFKWGTSEVPQDWYSHLTNILGKGFTPKMPPWGAKGLSRGEWKDHGELAVLLPDIGYDSDFWYTLYQRTREDILTGNTSRYREALVKYWKDEETFPHEGILLEKGVNGYIAAKRVLISSYIGDSGSNSPKLRELDVRV